MRKRTKPKIEQYTKTGARVRLVKILFSPLVTEIYQFATKRECDKYLNRNGVQTIDILLEDQLCKDYPEQERIADFNFGTFESITSDIDYNIAQEAIKILKNEISIIEKAIHDYEVKNNA